ncbi:unnamed protein product [Microthlaspi erraticum]|uniref:Uncharacterized protein n=1 Tax=Microthlaspi erraticum TaxID=1685480 RepID=A0A6D2J7T9_9BRAS|nr:unnamed protein product [Microthlaspi erraticum]
MGFQQENQALLLEQKQKIEEETYEKIGVALEELRYGLGVDFWNTPRVEQNHVFQTGKEVELAQGSVDVNGNITAHHLVQRICSKKKQRRYPKTWKFKYKQEHSWGILPQNEQHELMRSKKIICKMRLRQDTWSKKQYCQFQGKPDIVSSSSKADGAPESAQENWKRTIFYMAHIENKAIRNQYENDGVSARKLVLIQQGIGCVARLVLSL